MPTYYVTFGFAHTHVINGYTFDKDLVGSISAETYSKARVICFAAFGPRFCFLEEKKPDMSFFPRGVHPVDRFGGKSKNFAWDTMKEAQKRRCQLQGLNGKWKNITQEGREVIREAVLAEAEKCSTPYNCAPAAELFAIARAMSKEID